MSQPPQPGSGQKVQTDLDSATAIAGGSLGTLIAGIAQLLVTAEPLKSILIISSPFLAIGVSTGGAWLRRWYRRLTNEREASAALAVAEATLTKIIKDPKASKDHKDQARQDLEELRRLNVQTTVDYAKTKIKKRYDEQ